MHIGIRETKEKFVLYDQNLVQSNCRNKHLQQAFKTLTFFHLKLETDSDWEFLCAIHQPKYILAFTESLLHHCGLPGDL